MYCSSRYRSNTCDTPHAAGHGPQYTDNNYPEQQAALRNIYTELLSVYTTCKLLNLLVTAHRLPAVSYTQQHGLHTLLLTARQANIAQCGEHQAANNTLHSYHYLQENNQVLGPVHVTATHLACNEQSHLLIQGNIGEGPQANLLLQGSPSRKSDINCKLCIVFSLCHSLSLTTDLLSNGKAFSLQCDSLLKLMLTSLVCPPFCFLQRSPPPSLLVVRVECVISCAPARECRLQTPNT